MPSRRELRFDTLDDAVRDAEHLLAAGYERAGNWDLAQCCGHLSEWFRYQMEGFPPLPLWMRPAMWTLRNTLGPAMARKAIAAGTMRAGISTIPQSVVEPGRDATAAVATFRDTVARWTAHAGPLLPSPLFGSMTKPEWVKLHAIHAAHHLSFLVPKTAGV